MKQHPDVGALIERASEHMAHEWRKQRRRQLAALAILAIITIAVL